MFLAASTSRCQTSGFPSSSSGKCGTEALRTPASSGAAVCGDAEAHTDTPRPWRPRRAALATWRCSRSSLILRPVVLGGCSRRAGESSNVLLRGPHGARAKVSDGVSGHGRGRRRSARRACSAWPAREGKSRGLVSGARLLRRLVSRSATSKTSQGATGPRVVANVHMRGEHVTLLRRGSGTKKGHRRSSLPTGARPPSQNRSPPDMLLKLARRLQAAAADKRRSEARASRRRPNPAVVAVPAQATSRPSEARALGWWGLLGCDDATAQRRGEEDFEAGWVIEDAGFLL